MIDSNESVASPDSLSVDVLLQASLRPVQRWAHGRLPRAARSRFDTRDLVQEAALRMLGRRGTFVVRHPGAVEAYGYDAAALIRDFIAEGAGNRAAMLTELRRPLLRRGATGDTMIRSGGRIDKTLFLLKLEDGTIRELEAPSAAASRFEPAMPGRSQPGSFPRPQFDSRSMDGSVVR